jgi:hypothetical protein
MQAFKSNTFKQQPCQLLRHESVSGLTESVFDYIRTKIACWMAPKTDYPPIIPCLPELLGCTEEAFVLRDLPLQEEGSQHAADLRT